MSTLGALLALSQLVVVVGMLVVGRPPWFRAYVTTLALAFAATALVVVLLLVTTT